MGLPTILMMEVTAVTAAIAGFFQLHLQSSCTGSSHTHTQGVQSNSWVYSLRVSDPATGLFGHNVQSADHQ